MAHDNTHYPSYNISHLESVMPVDNVAKLIPLAKKILKRMEAGIHIAGEKPLQFDAIAFRGMSGCLFAAPLAYALGKPMILVRKKCKCGKAQSHSNMNVEGDRAALTYIIVDDFTCSGNTVREIHKAISNWSGAECVGIMSADSVLRYRKKRISSRMAEFRLIPIDEFVNL
jgi:adenine/guanine phosphoribosyltransferase-like PRPP-binding protein